MADQVFNVTIKGIGDFSDVVSNVNSVQKALTKLKLPDKLGEGLGKKFSAFNSEYEKYQKKISEGIKTQGDYNQVEKSLNRMKTLYQEIGQDVNKISKLDMDSILNLDLGEFKQLRNEIANIEKEINKIQIGKINSKAIEDPMKALRSSLKSKKFSEKDTGLLDQLIGNVKSGKVQEAKAILNELDSAVKKITPPRDEKGNFIEKVVGKLNPDNAKNATKAINELKQTFQTVDDDDSIKTLTQDLDRLQTELEETKSKTKGEILGDANKFKETESGVERVTDSLRKMHQEEFSFNKQVQDIDRQIQSYFGLSQMIRKVGDIARDAFNTVKELDQAMTETAVVTNFSVGDMWDMLPTYTEQANKLGATIKDVYEAATLYYQQGLNTNQAMGLANETLKMARIAGMDAAEATDMMTSALRGFNMEINQASAQKVNDIYSQLAAVTASDTRELGTAMEKTASLANSANMDIETTSAFLAQMIETTREAPENLGTAMKTIIARFQEMKKDPTSLVDADGVAMDVNKVDTALKSIGVALTNSKGEFRDLDDVFLDISKRWDSLSQGQQRYIATTAAGSRQQSRFIAMMSNYDRTMELVNEANNSAGASQKQFEKTMDSMSSKLNQLKNAWDEFTMGLMNNQILKGGVTALTGFFTVVNKIIDALGKISPKPLEGLTKSALTLVATLGGLNFGKKIAGGSVAAGVGWWKNEGTFINNFQKGYGIPKIKDYSLESDKLLQQKIENRLSDSAVLSNLKPVPVTVDTYLASIDTLDLDKEITDQIKAVIESDDTVANKKVKINTILDNAHADRQIDDQQLDKAKIYGSDDKWQLKGVDDLTEKANGLTSSLTSLGTVLQQVGAKMGPFGEILSMVGSVMVSLGTTLSALKVSFLENFATAKVAELGVQGFTVAEIEAGTASLGAAGSVKVFTSALASTLGPIAAIILAIGLVVVAYKALDAAIETDAERIERLTNSANTASDAYDSLKQSTSELKSSLEEIQSNEDSFEGLVAGTTEFNDKLTETNQKIDELIQKYPELSNYLSVDKNGLKHISQEGIDFIKKQQDQLVGNASAQNILQNARLKAEQDRQKVKQNEKEIEGIKYIKADPIYGGRAERKLTSEDKERIKQLEQESKYLEENVQNAERIATQQALAASFTNIEASDRERLASMYIDSYEAVRKRAETEKDESKMLQTYADYYGYKYDAASKKVLDSNNEEIEIDKDALKGVYSDIVATIDIQASAESLDKIENSVNQKFSKGLKLGASNGENILSGVLSGNIESDPKIVKKLAEKTPEQIEETLKELTDAEMSVLMGIKEEDFAADRENLRKEFANSIKDHAQKTFEAQSQVYEDLGAKIAKTQGLNFEQITKQYQDSTKSISEEISKLSVEQANTLNNIAGQLEENVGLDTTGTFLEKATSIYGKKDKKLTKEFDNILSGIKWDSASSRLAGYTKAINSSRKEIKEFGKDMKSSASEANILGEAFDEFVGGDWSEELRENIDDFQNSLGEIDGAGILKAAEQSNTLKNLLDSGAVSATGVAIALQGIEDGKYSVGEVDSAVLQLISSLNRLEDASLEAHNIVSNFDPGIDTGEGEDFIKNNAKAVAEFMENNEWGNDQLKNYIKLAAGEELWQKTLSKKKGDLKETTKALDQYVTKFKDGFLPAYKDIISGKGINGKSLTENIDKAINDKDISKKLGDKMKGVTAKWDENGFLQWDFNGLTTKQLEKFFQEAYGVSEEYAKLFLQDIKNYNETEGAELAKNDLKATIRSKDFQEARGAYGDNGKLILTDEDVRIFKAAGGSLKDLAEAAGISEKELEKNVFKVYKKNGERINNYADLLRDYAETFKTGEHKIGSLFSVEDLLTNGKLDLNKLIADTRSKSFDEEQSMRAAYEAYLQGEKQGDRTLYEGMEIEHGLQTYEDFAAALEGMTESSQWVQVGETIGTQIVNALNASSFLESMRGKGEGAAITEGRDGPKLNKENLDTVISQIQASGESTKEAQKDITTYLGQSKELFDSLKSNPEKQKEILDSVANKLKKIDGFDPQKINKVFRDSFDQGYDLYGIQKKISNMGASGKKAYDYYFKNGLGNTDLYNRPRIEWGEDPSKNKNYKNAHSWGENRESLKNRTSTYLSQAAGFGYGKDGKEVQIAFTPVMKGKNGEAKVLSKETVDSYLKDIVGQATNEKGNLDISKLMELDKKGLIMGAFKGEGAAEASGALGELEHYLEEAREKGLNLQEVLNGIKFSPKLKGQELENYIKKIDGLTGEQKEILLNTKITDKDKATQFIDTIEKEFGGKDKKKKEIILQATQKIAEGDKEGGQKLLKDSGFSEDDVKKITQQVEILYSGKIVNKDQFKKSIDEQIDDLLKSGGSKSAKKDVKVTGTATVKQDKPKDTKAGVKYEKKGQDNPDDKEAGVKYKLKKQDLPKPKTADLTYNLVSQDSPKPQKVDISPNFTGTWEKTLKIKEAAHGKNNHIQHSSIPSFGSAARGRYGTVGPKDKGGLTLTGEKGFEIAWLPSENRSMILGAGGPQMVNLPSDAVVYTHEQSKDIIKRKSIPAGSHSGRTDRDTTSTTKKTSSNPSGKGGNGGKGGKGGKNPKPKNNTKEIKQIIDKAGKVSVWWDNQTRKVDAVQRKVEKASNAFEKSISKFGVTFSGVKKDITDYTKRLKQSISLNTASENQAKSALKTATTSTAGTKTERSKADKAVKKAQKAYDKAKKTKDKKDDKKAKTALTNAKKKKDTAYGNTTAISWDVIEKTTKKDKKGKTKTTKKTVKKKENVNLSKYIDYNKDLDTYTINQAELDKIKSKNKKTAIKDAVQKKIDDNLSKRNTARDNIEKAQEALDKLADDVYKTFFAWENSLNKIYLLSQKLEDLSNRLSVRESNEELIETRAMAGFGRKDDRTRLEAVLKEERDLMKQQLEANRSNLTANADTYMKSLQLSTYAKRYANAPDSQEAKNDFEAAKKALEFLEKTGLNTSETFDYDEAIAELEKQKYSENDINRIKEVLDKINENRGNLVNAQNETLASATAIYSKLSDYQDFISDFENDLLSGLEEQTEKEINKLDKLNSSLSQAFKDLLDNVKQALDERRQQEDNTKTEQDISQKQQRLAALRADTSGGHQTEIAQLEKEINEAQQGYQRSLEDQLIDRLQQQGDNAEKQRQRQIELLQAQQEIAKITGSNIEQVKEWLADSTKYEEEIKNAWLSGKGYDEALPDEQDKLLNEWDATWAKYGAYSNEAKSLETAISTNETLSEVETIVSNIEKTLSQNVGNDIASFKESGGTAKEARLAGFSAGTLKSAGYGNEEIAKAGYNATDLNKAGITVNKTPAPTSTKGATSSTSTKEKALTDYKTALDKAASNKKTSANELKKLFKLGDNLNYSKAKVAKDLAKTALTWEQIAKAAKAAGYSRKTVASWSDSKQNKNATTAAKWKSYATGGLANFTGPAWLDGTPSKPELVLNSTDTRNFIALRDVLSKVMSSNDSTENSYANTEFNININIEKVADDYDVDKIITKVKKEITKSAGYRNVTQVRSFR